MKKCMPLYFFSLLVFALMGSLELHAGYTLKGGKLVNNKELATLSVQEHYSLAMNAYQKKNWEELVRQAIIVTKNFPASPFAHEALFYLGVGYFHLKDYELANEQFSAYLKKQTTPKFFEEAIEYKFSIAEKFQKGAKKHVMGWENMPKWLPAREEAIAIYDEVITALPHHDLAAQALYGKARLYLKDEDFKASIEAYQTLIRKFPKHSLAPQSYIGIAEVYLTQSQSEYPDPDFLDLAEINLRKFRLDFPGEERISVAEEMFLDMQEVYASSLFETGEFFERTKKPHAAVIYYTKIIAKYPSTKTAGKAQKRMQVLNKNVKKEKPVQEQKAERAPQQAPQETVFHEELKEQPNAATSQEGEIR
jgi:outer membrane protein assembly factor BamD (BamD/ComL family)